MKRERRVLVKDVSRAHPLLAGCLRVTVGTLEENRAFVQALAETLGAGPWRVFTTVTLPLASRNIVAGAVLGFSRALGEFGATIVVAGSIPGRTQTLAVGMYSLLEQGQDGAAFRLAIVSGVIALAGVWLSNRLTHEA